jgi:'Cold-shock' DNA-binding domain
MPTGKVKFYREDKGYGLMAPDDGGKAVSVHITSVTGACVMSSASVSAAAIRKRLMWWCCDLLQRRVPALLKQGKAIIA